MKPRILTEDATAQERAAIDLRELSDRVRSLADVRGIVRMPWGREPQGQPLDKSERQLVLDQADGLRDLARIFEETALSNAAAETASVMASRVGVARG